MLLQEKETSMRRAPITILMIDDDRALLSIYTRILEKHGYKTEKAETGREALGKLKAKQYDVAMIDVRLPDINGLDLLNTIQAFAPKTLKIMITGFPSPEGRETALSRGATAYLSKPVKTEELLRIIDSKLGPAPKP